MSTHQDERATLDGLVRRMVRDAVRDAVQQLRRGQCSEANEYPRPHLLTTRQAAGASRPRREFGRHFATAVSPLLASVAAPEPTCGHARRLMRSWRAVKFPTRDAHGRLIEETTMDETKWVTRWRYEIAAKPARPGVWRRRGGGFLIRGRAVDNRTGKMKTVLKTVGGMDANGAYRLLREMLDKIRAGETKQATMRIRFSEYAASLFERLVSKRVIKSVKTKQLWELVLRLHLFPAFGEVFVDAIRKKDVEVWLSNQARRVGAQEISPVTVNMWVRILRQIMTEAVEDLDLGNSPMRRVEYLDTSDHQTYTFEDPNSLEPSEIRPFLMSMMALCPQYFAMTTLGFATGLRPSSLRPLRRRGETPDVLWSEGVILIRRSQTIGDEVMEMTKQGTRYRIALPEELMDVLRWHVEQLRGERRESDLLFPGRHGGFMTTTALDKPFKRVVANLKMRKKLTPKGMRRTFQDLARHAKVDSLVQRAICGHATEEMTELYSTVRAGEIRDAVSRLIDVAGVGALVESRGASWCESGVKALSGPDSVLPTMVSEQPLSP